MSTLLQGLFVHFQVSQESIEKFPVKFTQFLARFPQFLAWFHQVLSRFHQSLSFQGMSFPNSHIFSPLLLGRHGQIVEEIAENGWTMRNQTIMKNSWICNPIRNGILHKGASNYIGLGLEILKIEIVKHI